MFGSAILDVGIGLVLVFLLVSLILTAVREVVETWMRSRSGDLVRGLYELLQRDQDTLKLVFNHPLVFALHKATDGGDEALRALGLGKPGESLRNARQKLPSYIPTDIMTAVLCEVYNQSKQPIASAPKFAAELQKLFLTLENSAISGAVDLEANVAHLYDSVMERATGWYKRRTQTILFCLGLAAALVFNINAVIVGNYLATSPQAREAASGYATQFVAAEQERRRKGEQPVAMPTAEPADTATTASPADDGSALPSDAATGEAVQNDAPPAPQVPIDQLFGDLQDTIGLPIGWSGATVQRIQAVFPHGPTAQSGSCLGYIGPILLLLAGYLITAFAATLGAPFWFDVLNRFVSVRSVMKPKAKDDAA